MTTTEKVYAAVKRLFKSGKILTYTKIGKSIHVGGECARNHVLRLVKSGKIKRNPQGNIVSVK